jgi:gliding motility-associatede transport system auxiliary component
MRSLLGPMGLVAIVFALLSVFLLAAGGEFGGEVWWVFGNLIIGVALLLGALVTNLDTLRERLRTGEARRAGKYGTSAILSTAFAIAILGMLGFLSTRYHKRFDASEQHVHSLSEQTQKVLAGLHDDVDVTALVSSLDAPPVREVLDRYSYASPHFKVQFADPTSRPDLVEKFGISAEKLSGGLVRVARGSDAVEIMRGDLNEEKLTNALVKLTRASAKKVYFLEGHGERPIQGEGADGKEGMAQAADALKSENYQVEQLLLPAKGEVPADAAAVIIAGPTRPLTPEEHAALERYLGQGGALLALLDPRAKTDLGSDLVKWGVQAGDDVIVDRELSVLGRPEMVFAQQYGKHPITQGLREVALFYLARSVRPTDQAKGRFTELVKSGANSWAERDLDTFFNKGIAQRGPDDLGGPVTLAVAGTPAVPKGADQEAPKDKPREPRLVVFGDSDFISNQLLDSYRNRDLFVNSVNWLVGDVESIAIRPNQARASRIKQLTSREFVTIRFLSLFVLPEGIAFAGVFAWWSRRRAPGR